MLHLRIEVWLRILVFLTMGSCWWLPTLIKSTLHRWINLLIILIPVIVERTASTRRRHNHWRSMEPMTKISHHSTRINSLKTLHWFIATPIPFWSLKIRVLHHTIPTGLSIVLFLERFLCFRAFHIMLWLLCCFFFDFLIFFCIFDCESSFLLAVILFRAKYISTLDRLRPFERGHALTSLRFTMRWMWLIRGLPDKIRCLLLRSSLLSHIFSILSYVLLSMRSTRGAFCH